MDIKFVIMCLALSIYLIVILKYTRLFGRAYYNWLQKYMDLMWGSGTFDVNKTFLPRTTGELFPLPILGLILIVFLFHALYGTVYLY